MQPAGPEGPAPSTYIRGAGAVPVDRHRVIAVTSGFVIAALASLLLLATVQTLRQERELTRLQSEGIPVSVTVTGCIGLASGSGITVSGYTCSGAFVLHGQRYDDELRGSTRLLRVGDTVRAVALPADPRILYASRPSPSSWRAASLPLALAAALVLAVGCLYPSRRRRSAGDRPGHWAGTS
jgi:hypothetical protein